MAAYGTLAAADAYHQDRGNTTWTGTDAAKQAALLRASDYVDSLSQRQVSPGVYEQVFGGVRTGGRAQARVWPRTGAYDSDGNLLPSDTVPVEVEYAVYEASLREITVPGSLAPDYVPATAVKREKVDVLEVEYATGTVVGGVSPTSPVIASVWAYLAGLIGARAGGWGAFVV